VIFLSAPQSVPNSFLIGAFAQVSLSAFGILPVTSVWQTPVLLFLHISTCYFLREALTSWLDLSIISCYRMVYNSYFYIWLISEFLLNSKGQSPCLIFSLYLFSRHLLNIVIQYLWTVFLNFNNFLCYMSWVFKSSELIYLLFLQLSGSNLLRLC
jgi:hypothetical protein